MVELPEIEVIRPDWPAPPNVHAFTTTRNSGFSRGSWDSLNLGANCGDDPDHVEKNRQSLLNLLPSEPRWLNQVHGAQVIAWDKAKGAETEADAIVSSDTGQVCAVLTGNIGSWQLFECLLPTTVTLQKYIKKHHNTHVNAEV